MFNEEIMGNYTEELKTANSYQQLKEKHEQLFDIVKEYIDQQQGKDKYENINSFQHFHRMLNNLHDHIIYRVLQLVELEMERDGWRNPPVSYCWMMLGSGGRGEQTLWTDQDHAIVYRLNSNQKQTDVLPYLEQIAKKIAWGLNVVGYPYCKGNVMATNPIWCLSLEGWKKQWQTWVDSPSLDHLRYFLISTDFRGIYGDCQLSDQLRSWFTQFIKEQKSFLYRVSQHSANHLVPVGWMGRIFPEQWGYHAGELNIKDSIFTQLVNVVRLWSLKYGIKEVNTEKRLEHLKEQHVWDKNEVEQWKETYYFLMELRLKLHSRERANHLPLDNYIKLKNLTSDERQILKNGMKRVKKWQKRTVASFS